MMDVPDPSVPSRSTRFRLALRALEARLAVRGASRRTVIAAIALGLVAAFALAPVLVRPGHDRLSSPRAVRPEPLTPPVPLSGEEAKGGYRAAPEEAAGRLTADRQALGPVARPASGVTAGGAVTVDVAWGRRIIRRATLEMESSDVERSLARLAEVVEAAGGYVAGTDAQTDSAGTVRARVTAHVPPDRFGRVLGELDGVGRVTTRRIGGEDVSEEFVDLQARIRNLERHEAQLVGFMTRAQKVSDLLALEAEIARVRGEVERLLGRIRFLKARTEMATVQVNIGRALVPGPADDGLARVWAEIRAALREAWLAAFRAVAEAVVLAVRMSPLLTLALAGWALYRRWARRRVLAVPAAP
jgi:hypothetical protein